MPGDGTRWMWLAAKKKLAAAEEENRRLRERIEHLEGMVYDLGGDPNA